MINFRKIKALIRLREAQDDLKAEQLAEKGTQQVLRKLNQGDFWVDAMGAIHIRTHLRGWVHIPRVIELLAAEGVVVSGIHDHVWGDNQGEKWTITLPEES